MQKHFPLFFMRLVILLVSTYSCVVAINITNLNINGDIIEIEGNITLDPSKLGNEWFIDRDGYTWYNHKGMLAYYEDNINELLEAQGFGFIEVLDLELEWLEIQNSEGYDVIGFKAKLSLS